MLFATLRQKVGANPRHPRRLGRQSVANPRHLRRLGRRGVANPRDSRRLGQQAVANPRHPRCLGRQGIANPRYSCQLASGSDRICNTSAENWRESSIPSTPRPGKTANGTRALQKNHRAARRTRRSTQPGTDFRTWVKPPSELKPCEGLGAIVEEGIDEACFARQHRGCRQGGSTKRVLRDSIEDAGKACRILDTFDAQRRDYCKTLVFIVQKDDFGSRRRESSILSPPGRPGIANPRYSFHLAGQASQILDTFDAWLRKMTLFGTLRQKVVTNPRYSRRLGRPGVANPRHSRRLRRQGVANPRHSRRLNGQGAANPRHDRRLGRQGMANPRHL